MIPNLDYAAEKAIDTLELGREPLTVLRKMHNVLLVPLSFTQHGSVNQAFTLVNKSDNGLQYIVLYNLSTPPYQLRVALAKQLAHVVLEHDGNAPEDVWTAEADCFAYHFLCPVWKAKKINFRPTRFCLSWEMKDMIVFESMDALKCYIAEDQNKVNKFIGKPRSFSPDDVELVRPLEYDKRVGWRNCFDIVLDGKTIGHCGE